jgi:hypothetical protein
MSVLTWDWLVWLLVSFQSLELGARIDKDSMTDSMGCGSLHRSQHSLMVPKNGSQTQALCDTLNPPVRIAVGRSPIFCNAPASTVIDYLHCGC